MHRAKKDLHSQLIKWSATTTTKNQNEIKQEKCDDTAKRYRYKRRAKDTDTDTLTKCFAKKFHTAKENKRNK